MTEESFNNADDIKQAVVRNGGVLTVTMEQLREAHGWGRLGPHVIKAIADSLANQALDFYPELSNSQYDKTRLFVQGTTVADLIRAVRDPNSANDEIIRRSTSGGHAEILAKVRALVCN